MQGHEKEATFGLNRVNFGARTLNPTTGVWDRVDAMSEKYFGFSPYNYTLNNPINAIDPDGNSVESFQGEAAQEAFRNHLAERGCPPNCGGGGGKTTATISPYKPDLADRMREGNILQQVVYGVADGVYSMFADNHLGGKAFENYDDKIKTKLGGFMTLGSPLLSGGGATASVTDDIERQILYHYTNEAGMNGIVNSKSLRPSLKALNPKDVHYGEGQYLSDILPGTKAPGQLSNIFINTPNKYKYTHYVGIDVTGLNVQMGRTGVYVVPNTKALDISKRIVNYGTVLK